MRETVIIKYDIYERIPQNNYNHEHSYDYAETKDNRLVKCHYGSDGFDRYITCYEDLNTEEYEDLLDKDIKFYLRNVGRVQPIVKELDSLTNMIGRTLREKEINGEILTGFMDYDENIFYVLR